MLFLYIKYIYIWLLSTILTTIWALLKHWKISTAPYLYIISLKNKYIVYYWLSFLTNNPKFHPTKKPFVIFLIPKPIPIFTKKKLLFSPLLLFSTNTSSDPAHGPGIYQESFEGKISPTFIYISVRSNPLWKFWYMFKTLTFSSRKTRTFKNFQTELDPTLI